MLSKEERLEVIEIIGAATDVIIEKHSKKTNQVIKEIMDYQTDRFLKLFDAQQKMLDDHKKMFDDHKKMFGKLEKLTTKNKKKLDGMKDALDDE